MAGEGLLAGALARFSGGMSDERDKQRELERRDRLDRQNAIQNALEMLQKKQAIGWQPVSDGTSDTDAIINENRAYGEARTPQQLEQMGPAPDLQVAKLPTEQGGFERGILNPDKTTAAHAAKRQLDQLTAKERMDAARQSQLEREKSANDYMRAIDLEKLRASLRMPPRLPPMKHTFDDGVKVSNDGGLTWFKVGDAPKKEPSPAGAIRAANYENSLRNEYMKTPAVDQAGKLANAYAGIEAASKRSDPQSNLALMYEAVKMRDPNAVREGELKLQESARSIPTWLRQKWDKAVSGNVLTDQERQQILEWAQQKVGEQNVMVRAAQKQFGAQARRFGADSSFVAPDVLPNIGTKQPNPYLKK